MKKLLSLVLALAMVLSMAMLSTATAETVYPDGTVSIYCTGQPQFLQMYFDEWIERNRDIAPGVKIEMVQIETMAAGRQKISMDYLAGAYDDMPDGIYLDAVGIIDLASAGLLVDVTDFYAGYADKMVDGAAADATIQGKTWGLPNSVRPQMMFYNAAIFEKYGIDPAMLSTMEGYLEVGTS